MAGPSHVWEGGSVARAELGFGEEITDKAWEEGSLEKPHLYVKGNVEPLQGFKQESYQICALGSPLWLTCGKQVGGKKTGVKQSNWGLLRCLVVTAMKLFRRKLR